MAVAPKKNPVTLAATAAPAPATLHAAPEAPKLPLETAEIFETIAAPARDVQENLRKAAEKGIDESHAAYARVKTAAEDATQSLQTSYAAAVQGFAAINGKAAEAMRANVEAGFGFFKALAGVKSLPEALEIQSGHARKQFDALTFQAKELTAMAQKIAADAVAPLKASLGKAMAQ